LSLLRAKVHSVKNSMINSCLSPQRPLDKFDPTCLFVYGTSLTKQLMTTFIGKSLGHTDLDWRKRTTWFTQDGPHNPILTDKDIENFVMACPFLDASGSLIAGVMPRGPDITPAESSNPDATTQVQSVQNTFIGPLLPTPPCAITNTPVTQDPLGIMAYCPQEHENSDDLGDTFNSLFAGITYDADGFMAQPQP
jgi:hypothetical protein